MCGIAGIVTTQARTYSECLQKMTDCLVHRGPDGAGVYLFENCALGHRRLSIVDLCTGKQPMLSADGRSAVTFNGEIYGYREIRETLADYPFHTASDTEVILALYSRYGTPFLDYLPGMFSFALWDEAHQELFCARDRFGEKPFFYAFGNNGEFLFASEIKAILASGLVQPVLDLGAVAHYLKYLYVHPSQTIYQNIHTLPPGHSLCYRNGRVCVERYWVLPATNETIKLPEAEERLRILLDQAVARQLVADVPVGAFLSGGLDSSTIVALASRHHQRLRTFSFDFEDASSELPYAREVAIKYGTDHMELADAGVDIGELLLAMQDVYDEPFADSSNIPTWLLAKQASQHVKVVLTGDGGDELLGGYPFWYRPLLQINGKRQSFPPLVKMLRLAVLIARRAGLSVAPSTLYELDGKLLSAKYASIASAHAGQQEWFSDLELAVLGLGQTVKPFMRQANGGLGSVDDAMRMDLNDYMPGDILVKIDRAAMAHGLELRSPFLDVDFATFCIALPWQLKLNNDTDKLVLRKAFADSWPKSLITRGKQGFGAPVCRWLKRPSVRHLKEKYLNNPRQKLFAIVSYERSRVMVRADSYQTWALLVLAMWLEQHEFVMP